MPVPYTFGTATAAIPLSQLDSNFSTAITIGNTAVQLGNTVTTLNNMTLANVTISSGNVTLTNVSVTTANVSGTANVSSLVVLTNETVLGNTTVTGNVTASTSVVTPFVSSAAATNLLLKSAGTTAVTIDTSQNVGVGVTPPTSTDAGNITIKGGSTLNFSTASGNMAANATFNSGWKYIATAAAVKYTQSGAEHQWFNAASGTAGNAITFTQAMTLDASSNLGVGATSPFSYGGGYRTIEAKGSTTTNGGVFRSSTSDASYIGAFYVNSVGTSLEASGATPILFLTNSTERARIDSSGNLIQYPVTTASGALVSGFANNTTNSTVNSTTYNITIGTSAKLFWIALGSGDAALVFTSYLSSSITFLGITPASIVASASPTASQLGISKSANSHVIVVKTGSALASTAATWVMGSLSSTVS